MRLIVDEEDFDGRIRAKIKALAEGHAVMDDVRDGASRAIWDALPALLARRFENIMPNGYQIHELQMKVNLGGKVFGVGIDGEVTISFKPK